MGENLNNLEIHKLKKFCDTHGIDRAEIDDSLTYWEAKEHLDKFVTKDADDLLEWEELLKDDSEQWKANADFYDSLSVEQKMFIRPEFLNCLVLKFYASHFGFAVDLLSMLFKGNMTPRTKQTIEMNKNKRMKHRVLWFVGHRKTTDRVLEELYKRNIRPRILRNSLLRRDFRHYCNGQILNMNKSKFKDAKRKMVSEWLKAR